MRGATGNIYLGLHEFYDMSLVLHFLRPEDLFFDVGANVGTYTILSAGACGAETWAFEPDPAAARQLRRNVALNGLADRVTVYEFAVGDAVCSVPFSIDRDTENRAYPTDGPTRQVQQTSVDEIVKDRCPSMMKFDIEGREDAAIAGARSIFPSSVLKVILAESLSEQSHRVLLENGFSKVSYDPFGRSFLNGSHQGNLLYLRDREFVEGRVRSAPAIKVMGQSI
jgi:FkbM family methyltransferase